MVAPTDTPVTGDIWHLTVDDLLAPLPETARLGGPGPFVINLSASSAPISLPEKGAIAGCPHAHVYQIQRTEDRRPRYRLRLGPFVNEDEADAILKKVRDIYPGALMKTADADDLRAIALQPAASPKPTVSATPAVPAKPTVSSTLAAPAKPMAPPRLTVSATPAVPAKPAVSAMPMAPPKLTVSATPAAPAKPSVSAAPAAAAKLTVSTAPAVPAKRTMSAMPATEQPDKSLPNLESTQTVRVLTQLELEDDNASRWFVIQLSQAADAFDPNTVPNLDIFRVYRLYSVAGIDQGRIVHSLRLGFFTEEIAAGAVASYLAAFYDKPSVKRVSSAERQRFAEQSIEPRKDVGASGEHAVIEITNERFVRERRGGQTAAK
jgi:hypothetical protein